MNQFLSYVYIEFYVLDGNQISVFFKLFFVNSLEWYALSTSI